MQPNSSMVWICDLSGKKQVKICITFGAELTLWRHITSFQFVKETFKKYLHDFSSLGGRRFSSS